MTPAEQQQRIQNSVAGWNQQLKTADSVHGGEATQYQNALAAQDYKNLVFDTPEPQKGSVNANLMGSPEDNQSEDGTPTITARNAANAPDINVINAIEDDVEFMRAYEASSKGL